MYNNVDLDRFAFYSGFYVRRLSDPTRPHSPLLNGMPQALAVLHLHHPDLMLCHISSILTDECTCLQLVERLPSYQHAVQAFWHHYWKADPTERLAVALFCQRRIKEFLQMMAIRWHEETA